MVVYLPYIVWFLALHYHFLFCFCFFFVVSSPQATKGIDWNSFVFVSRSGFMFRILLIKYLLLGIIMGESMWVWFHNVVIHAADHLNCLVC